MPQMETVRPRRTPDFLPTVSGDIRFEQLQRSLQTLILLSSILGELRRGPRSVRFTSEKTTLLQHSDVVFLKR
jgi:hypothetical protein